MELKFSSVLVNGEVIENKKLTANLFYSPSFQYGLNVFEGIRGYLNKNKEIHLYELDAHITRLLISSEMIGFDHKLTKNKIIEDIKNLLSLKSIKEDIYIKYILCILGNGSWASTGPIDRVVFYYPLKTSLRNSLPNSCRANFTSIERINSNSLPPQIKCGANYINSRLGLLDVNYRSDEKEQIFPIFLDKYGYVSESSGSCIFAVTGKVFKTPILKSSILNSITRKSIIKIIKLSNSYKIKETLLDRWDLVNADLCFLVGTNLEISIIKEINSKKYNLRNDAVKYIFENFKKLVFN